MEDQVKFETENLWSRPEMNETIRQIEPFEFETISFFFLLFDFVLSSFRPIVLSASSIAFGLRWIRRFVGKKRQGCVCVLTLRRVDEWFV